MNTENLIFANNFLQPNTWNSPEISLRKRCIKLNSLYFIGILTIDRQIPCCNAKYGENDEARNFKHAIIIPIVLNSIFSISAIFCCSSIWSNLLDEMYFCWTIDWLNCEMLFIWKWWSVISISSQFKCYPMDEIVVMTLQ